MIDLASKVEFDENLHSYTLNGVALQSVTKLLAKHKISPSFDGVPKDILEAAANRGTMIHEEIEKYCLSGEMGFTDEFEDFIDMVDGMASVWTPEVMVNTDYYAGRVDLIGIAKDDGYIIIDTKTGQVHENSVRWQVSMYGYALPDYVRKHIVGYYCFDAKPRGKDGEVQSRLIKLEPVSDENIEALIEADKKGEIYNPVNALLLSSQAKFLAVEAQLVELKKREKELSDIQDKIKKSLMAEMEKWDVKTIESPSLKITYVAPSSQKSIDGDLLKSKNETLYNECLKITSKKAYIKITVNECPKTEAQDAIVKMFDKLREKEQESEPKDEKPKKARKSKKEAENG